MQIRKPAYFDKFQCIAGRCPDSCCKEWSVTVDEHSAAYYRSLPGDLGDTLRKVLQAEDGETVMVIQDGRCPMWRTDGLCRIQAELGEDALCKVCREFPRLTHDYGDFIELGLELSCPEAARLILSAPSGPMTAAEIPGEAEPEYDTEAMESLQNTRQAMLALLSDELRPVEEILALALLFGCQAQSELDGGEPYPFYPSAVLAEATGLAAPGHIQEILDFFADLELLTPEWAELLRTPNPGPWQKEHLALARYLTERYWLQAVCDYDLYSRVKLLIIACLLVRHLGGDIYRTAQLFSKEIENNTENVEAILDAAYTHPAFRDDRLLGLLLGA